jgi:hypothetical protein
MHRHRYGHNGNQTHNYYNPNKHPSKCAGKKRNQNKITNKGTFLAEYHAQLVQPKIEINKFGVAVEMPKGTDEPQKVAEVHRLRMACDHFVNALVGIW